MFGKRLVKVTAKFIIFNIIWLVLTFVPVVLYGPFTNVRNTVIGSVSTSMHSSLLRYVLGDKQFNQILAEANGMTNVSEKVFGINSHSSRNITLSQIKGSRYKGYLLEVSDPTMVQVGAASELGTKGQTTSQIAQENGAAAAVNAGGFSDPHGTGTGRTPDGVVIHNGRFLRGSNIKGKVQLVGLSNDGLLLAGLYTVNEIKALNIKEGITFGPVLIANGQKQITRGDGNWGIGPRTAIGQRRDGTILILVIDGRQPQYSWGATLVDVQNVLYENGAYNAVNLDGGSSTTLYYNGKVINHPCDILGERQIPTAFIVKNME